MDLKIRANCVRTRAKYYWKRDSECVYTEYEKHWLTHARSSHRGSSMKKVLLKISQNSQENTCLGASDLQLY